MRVFIFPLAIVLGFIFQSCTVHSGQVVSLDYGQEVLPEDKAVGLVRVTNVLGIGGNNYDALYKEAKEQLIKNRPLSQDEKYVNVNVSIKTTGFLIGYIKKYILSADVVKIVDGEVTYQDVSEENIELISVNEIVEPTKKEVKPTVKTRKKPKRIIKNKVDTTQRIITTRTGLLSVGDVVTIAEQGQSTFPSERGTISKNEKGVFTVVLKSNAVSKEYKEFQLYRMSGSYKGLTIGQEYPKGNDKGSKIIGFGKYYILLQTNGKKQLVEY